MAEAIAAPPASVARPVKPIVPVTETPAVASASKLVAVAMPIFVPVALN